jgi:hypothetical protein
MHVTFANCRGGDKESATEELTGPLRRETASAVRFMPYRCDDDDRKSEEL